MAEALLTDLDAARAAFLDALAEVDAELATAPGVVGDWSVRDLVFHVAAWCEHGTRALDLAVEGKGAEFAYSSVDTDAMNDEILDAARTASPAEALRQEEAAFAAFRDRIGRLSPELLALRLGNGDTVAQVIRYDGPDHYAEHTEQLRAWFGSEDDGDAS